MEKGGKVPPTITPWPCGGNLSNLPSTENSANFAIFSKKSAVRYVVSLETFLFFLISFMTTGVIKTKTEKGFGFIAVQGSDDVFFHHSACNGQYDNLQVGQTVQFDVEQGEKGPKASNVVAVEGAAA